MKSRLASFVATSFAAYLTLLACQPTNVALPSDSASPQVAASALATTSDTPSPSPSPSAASPTAAPTTPAATPVPTPPPTQRPATPVPTPQPTPPPTPRPPTPVPTPPPPTPAPNPNALSISGTVTSGGAPVNGACITIGPPIRCAAMAGADGKYYISLDSAPPGIAWDVRALVGGVVKAERLGVVVNGPTIVNFQI